MEKKGDRDRSIDRSIDFIVKSEWTSGKKKRKGKRQYLNGAKSGELLRGLDRYLDSMVRIARIRIGKRQTLETLITEEALLLAKFLRNEREEWNPGIAIPF